MEILEVYKLKDGSFHETEKKAIAYCENKAGEELDQLMKLCPNLGIRAKVDIMNAILKDHTQFTLMVSWFNELNSVKKAYQSANR